MTDRALAQPWRWSPPFNHNEAHNGIDSQSNPYVPWGQQQGLIKPSPPIVGGQSQFFFGWPQVPSGPSFNAVHMALIPKGRYRGMVLVWNDGPVLGKHPTAFGTISPPIGAPEFVSFQAYSIIDPADTPTVTDPLPSGPPQAFRFRNFLLPVLFPGFVVTTPTWGTPGMDAMVLFCSGHTYSPFGDLVVFGGTDWDQGNGSPLPSPLAGAPFTFTGTKLTYVFNGRLDTAQYPTTASITYPGFQGLWQPGPVLSRYRWYPTGTLTHRIQRAPANNRELILVLGGSRDDNNDPYWNTPTHNDTWNDYEAFICAGESGPVPIGHNLLRDVYNGLQYGDGPGTQVPALVEQDWFEEYPRCHLLSTGEVFLSGYAPRWARLNPEAQGTWTRAALQTVTGTSATWGAYSSNWFDPLNPGHVGYPRHDGMSILFPNLGGVDDVVMRIGGSTDHWYFGNIRTTPTVETLHVGASVAWTSAPPMPTTHGTGSTLDGGRVFANAVILPTGGVVVIGGVHCGIVGGVMVVTPVLAPQLFEGGVWTTLPANSPTSMRDYHATAVLLDDGRVFIGGGNGRNFDYEILHPPYMGMVRPTNLTWTAPPPFYDLNFEAWELNHATELEMTCDPLPVGVALAKIVLTAPCSITHHSDMHQRYVEMSVLEVKGSRIKFKVPAEEPKLPRGLYMLWLVTNSGAPSNAMWVIVR